MPMVVLAGATGSVASIIFAVVLIILVVTLISLVSSALNGIFQAALYNYASTGETGQFFNQSQLAGAFKPKK